MTGVGDPSDETGRTTYSKSDIISSSDDKFGYISSRDDDGGDGLRGASLNADNDSSTSSVFFLRTAATNRRNMEAVYWLHPCRENTATRRSPPIPLRLKRLHFPQSSGNFHSILLILRRQKTPAWAYKATESTVERELKLPLPTLGAGTCCLTVPSPFARRQWMCLSKASYSMLSRASIRRSVPAPSPLAKSAVQSRN